MTTCVLYNALKEGSLVNKETTTSGVVLLDAEDISALYDNDLTTPAVVISGSKFMSVQQEFGEAFDVCYLRYYTTETVLSRISVSYQNNQDTTQPVSLFLESPGVVRGDINDYSRYINIRHDVVGTARNVYQLEIFGVKNEELGFGSSPTSQIDYYTASSSTANIISAGTNKVPLFNDSQYDDYAMVSVAPTLTEKDNYLFVATTSSGTFYGLNDYGFTQPGPNPIALQNDSMLSNTIDPQWERRAPAQRHKLTPTVEGLVFDLEADALATESSSLETTGIFSKEFFTAQSFTAEVQIRFLDIDNVVSDSSAKDFFFILTNSYPIPDVGYTDSWLTDNRRGASTIGLAMNPALASSNPDKDDFLLQVRWADGTETENPNSNSTTIPHEEIEHRWTGGDGSGFFGFGPGGEVGEVFGPSLGEFENIMFGGSDFHDFTSAANWHTWKIVYDDRKKQISAFADNIFLGSRVMRVEAPAEACKLFIGFHGNGGVKWALRNFKITPNFVYKQEEVGGSVVGGVATATLSGVIAGRLNNGNENSSYVGPNPTTNAHVRIDFPEPRDISFYSIKQHDPLDSVSGYFPDMARQALVDFGGKITEVHSYPNTDEKVIRSASYSNSHPTIVSGISYIDWQFIDYDRTDEAKGALIIDEIEVYAEKEKEYEAPPNPTSLEFPWVAGRWNNLRQHGSSNALSLKHKKAIWPSFYPIPEYTLEGVDYGFSSAVPGREFADTVNEYHHSGGLFVAPHIFPGSPTGYNEWHSDNQTDNHIFVWRSFFEMSRVKAVFWDSNTGMPSNVADKFKFQYLVEDGDPNVEGDWLNIPPVSKQHPYTGGSNNADTNYKNYKNYLITHHDGEYYTNYFLLTDYGTGFSVGTAVSQVGVPTGLVVPSNFVTNTVRLGVFDNPSANGLTGYIEFDNEILTRAIRMVVYSLRESGVESGSGDGLSGEQGDARTDFALKTFNIFRMDGAGSYTSPVFDTGTRQNTERLSATIKTYENTSINKYIRSNPEAPDFLHNTQYEVWESQGLPGNTDISFSVSVLGVNNVDRVITRGNKSYFIRQESVRVYDHVLDLWSSFSAYPTSSSTVRDTFDSDESVEDPDVDVPEATLLGSSSGLTPDDSVTNLAVLFGDVLYVAVRTSTGIRTPRLMYYNFSSAAPKWISFSFNRPPITENTVMIGHEEKNRLYFFNREGVVSYYDIASNNWVIEEAELPLFGSDTRRGIAAAYFENKAYFFGGLLDDGNGTTNCNVFDFDRIEFSSIASAPYRMYNSQAVVVPEERVIYVLPTATTFGFAGYNTFMKYYIDSDSWEICESLMWSRDLGLFTGQAGAYHFYYNGYLYRMITNIGLSRAYARKTPWVGGKVPDFRDPVWGGRAGTSIPWIKVDSFGELMPQERYVQFKVELHSDDRIHTPILEDITVVMPQEVFVPASGTSNIYLKVGVSPEELYEAWYSAETIATGSESPLAVNDYSILYTKSSNGQQWGAANTVLEAFDDTGDVSITARRTYSSPWVIKESLSSYKVWITKDYTLAANNAEIYYYTTSDPANDGTLVLSVAKGALPQSVNGAKQPCVIKESASSYVMWYVGLDSLGARKILRAISSDGISWSSHTVSLSNGNVSADAAEAYRPCVIKDGSLYRMWYSGVDASGTSRVLYTESPDGIAWEAPVVSLDLFSEGEVDTEGCFNPLVLKDVDAYVMYYLGDDGTDTYIVRATSPDGLEWFDFEVSISAGGLSEYVDGAGLEDVFVLLNKDPIDIGSMITGSQLKLYNKGAAV